MFCINPAFGCRILINFFLSFLVLSKINCELGIRYCVRVSDDVRWLTGGPRLVASVRLEPQVTLPEGTVQHQSSDGLSFSHVNQHHEHFHHIKPLKVDRFTVTNGDFKYYTFYSCLGSVLEHRIRDGFESQPWLFEIGDCLSRVNYLWM